jgi:hypothetical protein
MKSRRDAIRSAGILPSFAEPKGIAGWKPTLLAPDMETSANWLFKSFS